MLPVLPRIVIHSIRSILRPIRNETVQKNHISSDYEGPDFAHPVHIPRSHHRDRPTEDNFGIDASLLRCYDFLTMDTRFWEDINIFVASVFSNSAGYSVLWCVTRIHTIGNYGHLFKLTQASYYCNIFYRVRQGICENRVRIQQYCYGLRSSSRGDGCFRPVCH